MFGDDVGLGSALDVADVDGDAGVQAVELVDCIQVAHEGENGAASLLRLDARMGCLACHAHRAPDRRLARSDDVAVGACRFQRKGDIRLARHLADERDGAAVVHLLVADAEEVERTPAVKAGMVERLDGVETAEQPSLHVARTRPQHLVALNRERARRRRAHGEDGVGVAEQHQTQRAGTAARGQEVVAEQRLAVAPAGKAKLLQAGLHPVLHGIDPRLVVCARFEGGQRAQVGQVTRLLRRQIGS